MKKKVKKNKFIYESEESNLKSKETLINKYYYSLILISMLNKI